MMGITYERSNDHSYVITSNTTKRSNVHSSVLAQNEVLACIELGKLLYQKQQMKIKHIVNKIKNNKYKFRNYTFIMYNCDSELTSDLGNELTSIYCDFAILWSYDHMTNYYHYSLRSTDKVNCAKLAQELLEGGGHSNAAGGKHKSHPNILFNCNI